MDVWSLMYTKDPKSDSAIYFYNIGQKYQIEILFFANVSKIKTDTGTSYTWLGVITRNLQVCFSKLLKLSCFMLDYYASPLL